MALLRGLNQRIPLLRRSQAPTTWTSPLLTTGNARQRAQLGLAAPGHDVQDWRIRSMAKDASEPGMPATAASYNDLTVKLVGASSIPFTILVAPQLIQNYASMMAGDTASLAAISWIGYSAGLAGNALMCTHLAARRECTAVNVQLMGMASTMALLTQLWYASVMPTAAFAVVAVAAAGASTMGVLQASGKLPERVWAPFELLMSVMGVVAVPQVLWSSFAPGSPTPTPSLVAIAAAGLWLRSKASVSPQAMREAVSMMPGWLATCMFTLSPIPQLVRNFTDLSSLGGLSLGTMHLALLGNALCIPRALYTKDPAWTLGTTWGCLSTGWAQLLCMYLGTNPTTGASYITGPHFAAVSAALAAYFLWLNVNDAKAKGLGNPMGSYPDLLMGKKR